MKSTSDLKVFISSRDSTCDECGEPLGRSAWIMLAGERGVLCLACADLEHLAFLPSGDAALTRRAKKHSRRHAVVLKWSRRRKRYERQGLLVEEEALAQAETECLAVIAHVRHTETNYDVLLGRGADRHEARRLVQDRIARVLAKWEA
jgi:hypothetical protein